MKINKLFKSNSALAYLQAKVPAFTRQYDLNDLKVNFIKKNLDPSSNFYHVILRFDSRSLGEAAIFVTAHSQEDRGKAYQALRFLSERGFKDKDSFLARPLFYDEELNGFFYLGIRGESLLKFIKSSSPKLTDWLPKIGRWTAALHNTPVTADNNFNAPNSRIATAIPGPAYFLEKISRLFPAHREEVRDIFERLCEAEDKNLKNLERLALIHGDLHPENVVVSPAGGIVTIIDYTDISLSDWARDLGNFVYQFNFMSAGFLPPDRAAQLSGLFLKEYFATTGIKDDASVERRINLYKSWAALRATIYFLVKGFPEEKNAAQTLKDARHYASLL